MTPRYQHAVERLHALGARAVAELLIEADAHLDLIEKYARLDEIPPTKLKYIGATTFAPLTFLVSSS